MNLNSEDQTTTKKKAGRLAPGKLSPKTPDTPETEQMAEIALQPDDAPGIPRYTRAELRAGLNAIRDGRA